MTFWDGQMLKFGYEFKAPILLDANLYLGVLCSGKKRFEKPFDTRLQHSVRRVWA